VCHQNLAVIFTKKIENGKSQMEGFCYNCAKEKGINPIEVLAKQANLSEDELNDMSKQFENIFEDLSENIDIDEITSENLDGKGIPFGSIISNMFGDNKSESKKDENTSSKKVRTEKRPKEKKKSFLDIYGTNLTTKAKNSLLDNVIGRDSEIRKSYTNFK